MELFWTPTAGLSAAAAHVPGRSRAPGSAFAWALLAWAVRQVWGMDLPEVAVYENGKPYFPAYPELHFSLSHTGTAVLVALSAHPVGADVERRRAVRPALERLADGSGDLELFELWTLRESCYKLTGRGSLRTLPFSRAGGVILPPEPGLRCRLYAEIPGCAAAACSFAETPPERLRLAAPEWICT